MKGITNGRADIPAGIARKTGLSAESRDKVPTALEEALSDGVSDKLKFFN